MTPSPTPLHFRIADTFTDSLARLTSDEQKLVKTTAFDLQMNPVSPGHQFHRLDRAKDRNFWSVRVGADVRLIVHRSDAGLLLCYVAHHDPAYRWAEQRRLERHPTTGAAQLVELRETVREIEVPRFVTAPAPALFSGMEDADLLGFGVPSEWLVAVRRATEDSILDLVSHLPGEAAEALLELATGGRPRKAVAAGATSDPFAHPDAQRRFRVMANVEELTRALDAPWEKWIVFLHPAQRETVERQFSGPARVAGSAGTGKTIVALHRAVYLARAHPEARVLLATFSEPLAAALHQRLLRLIGSEPRLAERLEVQSMASVGRRLYEANFGEPVLADDAWVTEALSAGVAGLRFPGHFVRAEWDEVVDAWQLADWESYRDVARLGRKTRLSEKQRAALWSVFEPVRGRMATEGLLTYPGMLARVTERLSAARRPAFDFVVVDEAQDVSVPELRLLAALGGHRPDGLFFAGDLGQRIFRTPFSWKSLGVDVRGRSQTLRINYRTSHQIRRQADRLLPPEMADVDGNVESRRGTVSVFNGDEPDVRTFADVHAETGLVAGWLSERSAEGYAPHEIGLFVRSEAELERARAAIRVAGLKAVTLDGAIQGAAGSVAIGTMHLAKGLEYRGVVVMACDEDILPLASRIELIADDADLADVYETERHLLYVACTRARDRLLVCGVAPGSEFLVDLVGPGVDRGAGG